MQARGVEVRDPCRDLGAGVIEIEVQRLVEKLIAHATAEAFDEAVLHRLLRRNEVPVDGVSRHQARVQPHKIGMRPFWRLQTNYAATSACLTTSIISATVRQFLKGPARLCRPNLQICPRRHSPMGRRARQLLLVWRLNISRKTNNLTNILAALP